MKTLNCNDFHTVFISLTASDYKALNRISSFHDKSLSSFIVSELQDSILAFEHAEEFASLVAPTIKNIIERGRRGNI